MTATGSTLSSQLTVLLFTDLVGSTGLKNSLGDRAYAEQVAAPHNRLFRELLEQFPGASENNYTGDGFLATFPRVSDAVNFALLFQQGLLALSHESPMPATRIGIHLGEMIRLDDGAIAGQAADLCARLMSLATGRQILLTRHAFDDARQHVRHHPPVSNVAGSESTPVLGWQAHGRYEFKGKDDDPLEVFEVGAQGFAPLQAPADSDKVKRKLNADEEATLGWRPALGQAIPQRPSWILQRQLGEGGFGEVWLVKHQKTQAERVYKFCFDADRLRSFKRELTLSRWLRQELGDRPDLAKVHDIRLDQAPFYLELDYAPLGNLHDWVNTQQGLLQLPLAQRLELLARICDAVEAAHTADVLHKDLKPSNILMYDDHGEVKPRLCDFGIGFLADMSRLEEANITRMGFTQTMLAANDSSRTGTRLYTPPECLMGMPFTKSGDVYALGVMLYQVIIGKFDQPIAYGWEREVAEGDLEGVPNDAGIITQPSSIAKAVYKETIGLAVEGNPARRVPSAGELARLIRALPTTIAAREAEETARVTELAAKETARKTRALKWVIGIAASVLAVVGTLGVLSYMQWQRAEEAKDSALASEQKALEEKGRADEKTEEANKLAQEEHAARLENERLAAENIQRLARLYVSTGNNAIEKGELWNAMNWFAKAWKIDESNSSSYYNILAANILHRLPRLVDAGFYNDNFYKFSITKDEKLLAVNTQKGKLLLFSMTDLTKPRVLNETGRIVSMSLSKDGTKLAGGDLEGNITIYNTDDCSIFKQLKNIPKPITAITFDQDDEKTIYYVTDSGGPYKWQVMESIPHEFSKPMKGYGNSIADTENGHLLVNCGNQCAMFDKQDLSKIDIPEIEYISDNNGTHSSQHNAPIYSKNNNSIYSSSRKGAIAYDITNKESVNFDTGLSTLGSIKPSPKTKYIAYARGGYCIIYDAVSKKQVSKIMNPNSRLVQSIAWHPNEQYIAVCSTGGDVHIWDVVSRMEVCMQIRHNAFVCNMQFIDDGNKLLTCGIDGMVKIIAFNSLKQSPNDVFVIPTQAIQKLGFDSSMELNSSESSSVQESVYTMKRHPDSVNIYRRNDQSFVKKVYYEQSVIGEYISSDDNFISILGSNRRVTVFEIASGRKVSSSIEFENYLRIKQVDYSKTENLLLVLFNDNTIAIYSATYGNLVYGPGLLSEPIEKVSFAVTSKGVAVQLESSQKPIKYLLYGGYNYQAYKTLSDIYTCSDIDNADLNSRFEKYTFNSRSSQYQREMLSLKELSAATVSLISLANTNKAIAHSMPKAVATGITKMPVALKQVSIENQLIDYRKAREYIGREVSVDIVVGVTTNVGWSCFLNVDNKRHFVVKLLSKAFKDMPVPPEDYFQDKRLLVTGKVTLRSGNPQIEVHDLGQIKVLTDEAKIEVKPSEQPNPASAVINLKDVVAIDYKNAREFVDKEVVVEITVTQTGNIGKICFLNVDNAREFVVPLFSETFKDVPGGAKPEVYYLNKQLRVTGKVALYKDKPQIEVHDLKQIQVLDDPVPAKPAPAKPEQPAEAKPTEPASFQYPHIKPELAGEYLGKPVVIEGLVDRLVKKDGEYRFDFGAFPPEDMLTVVIPKDLVEQFPRDPEGLFLYQHVLVSGEVETVELKLDKKLDKKLIINIKQTDQIRLDRVSGKIAQTKVVTVDEALARDGEYLGVQGAVEAIEENDLFYLVKLLGTNGKAMKIAVDKICLPSKDAKAELESKAHTYYGKITAKGKAAQMIIGDQREIVPATAKKD